MDKHLKYFYLVENAPCDIKKAMLIEESKPEQFRLEEKHILRLFFINLLKQALNMTETDYNEWGYDIFYEIYFLSEFKLILDFVASIEHLHCLRYKDKHNEHRLEKQFKTAKRNFIEKLIKNDQLDEASQIEKINYRPEPTREDVIKDLKKILFTLLTGYIADTRLNSHCNTSKNRARKIIKLLNKI